jgi:hypothetical protein
VREGEGGRAIEREATAGLGFCAGWRWIGFAELGSVTCSSRWVCRCGEKARRGESEIICKDESEKKAGIAAVVESDGEDDGLGSSARLPWW